MILSKNSLRIQNGVRRHSGLGENPSSSTNLFKKLRKLDRQITELDNIIRLRSFGYIYFEHNVLVQKREITDIICISNSEWNKLINRRINLDLKRKAVRLERKSYGKISERNN